VGFPLERRWDYGKKGGVGGQGGGGKRRYVLYILHRRDGEGMGMAWDGGPNGE